MTYTTPYAGSPTYQGQINFERVGTTNSIEIATVNFNIQSINNMSVRSEDEENVDLFFQGLVDALAGLADIGDLTVIVAAGGKDKTYYSECEPTA